MVVSNTMVFKVALILVSFFTSNGFCRVLQREDDDALDNQSKYVFPDTFPVKDQDSDSFYDEDFDVPILALDEGDEEYITKLCTQYKSYIIKSPSLVVNCNGYYRTEQANSKELTETEETYDYERQKRSYNETDFEGSGEITEAGTDVATASDASEDALLPVDETAAPVEEPAEEAAVAVDETDNPGEEAVTAEEAGNPAEEAAVPAEETDNPGEEAVTAEEAVPAEEAAPTAEATVPLEEPVAPEESPVVEEPTPTESVAAAAEESEQPSGTDNDKTIISDTVDESSKTPGLEGRFAMSESNSEDEKTRFSNTADDSIITAEKSANTGETKANEPETTKASSGGGKITLLIVAGIVILGAAAFAYNYCKKKIPHAEPVESQDKELVEITVNKKVDAAETPATNAERKPLLENRKDANGLENNKEELTKEESSNKKVVENGNGNSTTQEAK